MLIETGLSATSEDFSAAPMGLNSVIMAAVIATAVVLLLPRFATAPGWRAAVTPLASISGSGFLVLGPILDTAHGFYASLVMAGLERFT